MRFGYGLVLNVDAEVVVEDGEGDEGGECEGDACEEEDGADVCDGDEGGIEEEEIVGVVGGSGDEGGEVAGGEEADGEDGEEVCDVAKGLGVSEFALNAVVGEGE